MLRFYELLVIAHGQTLGVSQRLLELGGQFIDAHDSNPSPESVLP